MSKPGGTEREAPLAVARDERGVATVTLQDRAGRNALSEALVRGLLAALEEVGRDPEVRVVVLLGEPDVFCAGASREVLAGLVGGRIAPADLVLPKAVLDLPVPSIAALEGHATGGGLALGLCADLVLLARESRYSCSFMNMGFTPGMGTTRLLEHVLSPAIAHELLYTGQAFRGSHFEGRSGVNYILPRPAVRPKAMDLAARIAEKPRVALEALKRCLSLGRRQAFEATRTVEALMHQVSFAQPEIQALIEENYA